MAACDPDNPSAVDIPATTAKKAPRAAVSLAETLVAMVHRALDPADYEDKAAAAAASRWRAEEGTCDDLEAGDEQELYRGRPRLLERLPLTIENATAGKRQEEDQQPEGPSSLPLPEQEPLPPPPSPPAAGGEGEGSSGRRSARQASRASTGKRPAWAALMAGGGADLSKWWWSEDEEDKSSEDEAAGNKGKRKWKRGAAGGASEPPARPRTVGRAPVQVFRGVVPKAAIDLLMKGERADETRNPWPGVHALLQPFMQRAFATSFRHPYIAEISSRCDSVGPPQRLDLALSPSGVRALLTSPAIAAIEAIVWGLKRALQFTGKVTWDPHLVIVLPGAPEQRFHVDSARSWFYFTLLMPLTKDPPSAGRTEFFRKEDQPHVPVGVGDCLVFDGRRRHRGQRNNARSHVRVFLYIAVYSGMDYN